jgi:hypothetical protein
MQIIDENVKVISYNMLFQTDLLLLLLTTTGKNEEEKKIWEIFLGRTFFVAIHARHPKTGRNSSFYLY